MAAILSMFEFKVSTYRLVFIFIYRNCLKQEVVSNNIMETILSRKLQVRKQTKKSILSKQFCLVYDYKFYHFIEILPLVMEPVRDRQISMFVLL